MKNKKKRGRSDPEGLSLEAANAMIDQALIDGTIERAGIGKLKLSAKGRAEVESMLRKNGVDPAAITPGSVTLPEFMKMCGMIPGENQ
jgi:hypothetical protein